MSRFKSYAPLVIGLLLFTGWFVFLRPSRAGRTGHLHHGQRHQHGAAATRGRFPLDAPAGVLRDRRHRELPRPQGTARRGLRHRAPTESGQRNCGLRHKGRQRGSRSTPWTPRDADIIGRLAVRVPKVGFALMVLHSPLAIGTLAGGITAFVVMRRPEQQKLLVFSSGVSGAGRSPEGLGTVMGSQEKPAVLCFAAAVLGAILGPLLTTSVAAASHRSGGRRRPSVLAARRTACVRPGPCSGPVWGRGSIRLSHLRHTRRRRTWHQRCCRRQPPSACPGLWRQ